MENPNTGLNGPKNSDFRPGDYENFAGVNKPKSINRAINEDAYTSDNPEDILIAKERWDIINRLLRAHSGHKYYVEWVLDLFAGYSYAEVADRHSTTKSNAQYRVDQAVAYLKSQVKDLEF